MKGYNVARKDKPAPEVEAPVEAEAKAPKEPKAPVNPQVPAEYKNPTTGRYLPGRDARHASDVAKAIAAGGDEQTLLASLGSDLLRTKAIKQSENLRNKIATAGTPGFAIIGKQEFEARKVRGSGVVNVDGDNGWVSYDADTEVAKSFESVKDREKAAAEAEKAGMAEDAD